MPRMAPQVEVLVAQLRRGRRSGPGPARAPPRRPRSPPVARPDAAVGRAMGLRRTARGIARPRPRPADRTERQPGAAAVTQAAPARATPGETSARSGRSSEGHRDSECGGGPIDGRGRRQTAGGERAGPGPRPTRAVASAAWDVRERVIASMTGRGRSAVAAPTASVDGTGRGRPVRRISWTGRLVAPGRLAAIVLPSPKGPTGHPIRMAGSPVVRRMPPRTRFGSFAAWGMSS